MSRRPRDKPRARVTSSLRLTLKERREGALLSDVDTTGRPEVRADCEDGPRPCPWVGCRYHLYLDVTPAGGLKINFPDRLPEDIPFSCALDLAGDGENILDTIGEALNITRERVRQVEHRAMMKLRKVFARADVHPRDFKHASGHIHEDSSDSAGHLGIPRTTEAPNPRGWQQIYGSGPKSEPVDPESLDLEAPKRVDDG